MSHVSYDRRAVTIDGKRTLLLSGAIHYPRSTPAMWPELFRRSREAGLNAVETYVFWNLHERRRGVLDFSSRLDLPRFCRLAQEQGLFVILRIGPYICAETNYGGFPAWLRDVPGMQMRTYNEPFLREKARWVRLLCETLRPLFAPQGGPIILAQIENEYGNVARTYGPEGERYLPWCIGLCQSLNLGIPWIMCSGGAPGAIESINGFYAHEQLDAHFAKHPDQPALWTEHWPGWYDTYGYPHHVREPEDVAYAAARFFAAGGAGMNYYMWHGGTNFGRESMYLQTTSYDFDAPLDEFGLPTTKSNHLARLHRILQDHAGLLVGGDRPAPRSLGEKQAAYVYASGDNVLVFLCNDDRENGASVTFAGQNHRLPARSVILTSGGRNLLTTAEVASSCVIKRAMRPLAGQLSAFGHRPEPVPADWPKELRSPTVAPTPVEQLQFTHDETDYCWYSTSLAVSPKEKRPGALVLDRAADVVHVFIDGQLVATSPAPLAEDRGAVDGDGYRQTFPLELKPGKRRLALLCCSLGLIKGDWMLGQRNMAEERKGLWGAVTWNGQPLPGPWELQPGLVGQRYALFTEAGALANWKTHPKGTKAKPLGWLRATFARPAGARHASPLPIALALDLAGMAKGMIWLNGRCAGRYWLTPGVGKTSEWLTRAIGGKVRPEPTQRYYHLPTEWLADRNVLVLFEEIGGDPATIKLVRRV